MEAGKWQMCVCCEWDVTPQIWQAENNSSHPKKSGSRVVVCVCVCVCDTPDLASSEQQLTP